MTQRIPISNSNHPNISPHSGSYLDSDVSLLLDIVDRDSINDVPVSQKEVLIQSGKRHYSDMLTIEQAPSTAHRHYYQRALAQGGQRMANDIANLAGTLHDIFADSVAPEAPLILVSLVRAGLPLGVLLQRALQDKSSSYPLPSRHYGVSIIRDRGLDPVALQKILTRHPDSPIVMVDGWTGKGAIYKELVKSLAPYNNPAHRYYSNIFHQGVGVVPLLTLADPAGVAWLAGSHDDWLIPSGLLGCTVSGLISRTLYSPPSSDFSHGLHRSILYEDLVDYDDSLAFIQTIDGLRKQTAIDNANTDINSKMIRPKRLATYSTARYFTRPIINRLAKQFNISNRNRIKPTIAEATRAILRRDPERVLLATSAHPDTILLRHLCEQRHIITEVVGNAILPYQAVTIIKQRRQSSG